MSGRFSSLIVGAFLVLVSCVCQAGELIDFENDLIPVLTKNGCNAGACHGAAIGRGGFSLSLYGGDPLADYQAIVRQVEGRRINLARPDESLVVLKPAEQLEHGGGNVFDLDGESARLLIDWIKQGASQESQRELTRIDISPKRSVAKSLKETMTLRAVAHYSDGTSRDVTHWTIFAAEDSSAVDIDSGTSTATILRRGRHIVVARYLSKVVPIELIAPLADEEIDLATQPRANFIDEEILDSLGTLRLPPSRQIDDANAQFRTLRRSDSPRHHPNWRSIRDRPRAGRFFSIAKRNCIGNVVAAQSKGLHSGLA